MLTPQAIKDQEFNIKFRGYDAIEVKAYLELLAEDFFELTEQNRIQGEELESYAADLGSMQKRKDGPAGEGEGGDDDSEDIRFELDDDPKAKDQQISDLKAELEKLQETVTTLEKENKEYLDKMAEMEEKVAENEVLRGKIAVVEEQNKELKKEGLDFKTTILAAQKFADNLRKTSEEDALKLMEEAIDDVEKFRSEAHAELARLPKEIDELKQKKNQVREELRAILQTYLDELDTQASELMGKDDDLADLFQTILLPEKEDADMDDIDSIDMKL